jgi:O-antigen ligase
MARTNGIKLSQLAFWTFTLSVALLPIGLGGDRVVPLGLAQLGLSLSCLLLVADHDVLKFVKFPKPLRASLGLFLFVMLWCIFQVQPFIPAGWTHPLWQETAKVLHTPVKGMIAIAPEAAINCLSRLFTYILVGAIAFIVSQDSKRAKKIIQVLWYVGSALCVYGLGAHLTNSNSILWWKKWAYIGDLTATFVNRNHFAIYADMIFVTGLSLLAQSWREATHAVKKHQRVAAIREWLTHTGLTQIFLLLLVFISVIYSHSRAGFALLLAGTGFYAVCYQIYRRAWKRAVVLGIAALVIVAVGIGAALMMSDRFAVLFHDYSSLDRLKVYKLTLQAIRDNPWLGYGLNGFEPEFRLYQQNMIMEFNHAHSDVLEMVLDLGVPVAALMAAAIGILVWCLVRGVLTRRQNGMYPVLGLTVTAMMLAHACVDFSLQIPGDAVTWAAIMGTGLAQSWSSRAKHT